MQNLFDVEMFLELLQIRQDSFLIGEYPAVVHVLLVFSGTRLGALFHCVSLRRAPRGFLQRIFKYYGH